MAVTNFFAVLFFFVICFTVLHGTFQSTTSTYYDSVYSPQPFEDLFLDILAKKHDIYVPRAKIIRCTEANTKRLELVTLSPQKYSVEKVSYYPNFCTSFNIELLKARDIEVNPGDVKSPCSVCHLGCMLITRLFMLRTPLLSLLK